MVSNFWQNTSDSVVKIAFELSRGLLWRVFIEEKHGVWSIIFPDFQAVQFQKRYRNWNLHIKRYKWGKFLILRKTKSVKFCWAWCKNFQQGCKMYIICLHRELLGFDFFIGLRSNFVRTFADQFLSKLAELISKKLTFSKYWGVVFRTFW